MKKENSPVRKETSADESFRIIAEAPDLRSMLAQLDPETDFPAFGEQLAEYMKERSMGVPRLSAEALLSRSFTYQLCSGIRSPGRDIVLRLAIVLRLSVKETQRLLRSAERAALCPQNRRDAVIAFCLYHNISLSDADEILVSLGDAPLL